MLNTYPMRVFRLSTRLLRVVQSWAHVSLVALLSLLPLPLAYRMARGIGRVRCALDVKRRDACTTELAARLGIDRDQARRIARRSFEMRACEDLEDWLVLRVSKDSLGRLIQFEGLEHLESALAGGKGAVLYTGHIWGTRLCVAGLGLLGYPVVILRHLDVGKRDPARRWLFDRYRKTVETRLGGRMLGSVGSQDSMAIGPLCVNALRRNEIVALKPDRLHKRSSQPGDLEVRFLNGKERFIPGGVLLARAAGAPLLSLWIHRPTHFFPGRCVIGPPIEVGGDVRVAVETQVAHMEALVRKDPACLRAFLARVPAFRQAGSLASGTR